MDVLLPQQQSPPQRPSTIYVSAKCYSTTLSSFDSSINNRSSHVAHGLVYSLARQLLLFLFKNSTANVLILYISWIVICANSIFSLYTFPFAHFKDDDECGGNLKANGWIFNRPFLSILFNYSSTSIFHLSSLLYAFFSFFIIYSFSITLSALTLLWIPKLSKRAKIPTTNANYFWWLHHFFSSLNFLLVTFIFLSARCFLINIWSLKLILPITTSLCPLYNHMEALCIIIMNERPRFHLLIIPHL